MSFIGLSAIAGTVGAAVGGGTLGAVVGGATAGVVGGAGLGAITSAATGQDIGKGVMFGALGGGLTGGAGGALFGGAGGSAAGAGTGAGGAGGSAGGAGGSAGGSAGGAGGSATGYVAQQAPGIVGGAQPAGSMGSLAQEFGLVGTNGIPAAGAAPGSAGSGITPSGIASQGSQVAAAPPLSGGGGGAFGQIAEKIPETLGKTAVETGVNKSIEGVSNTIAANKAKKEDEARGNAFYAANPELGNKPLAGGGSVALSDGQFIIPADIVSALGNGSTKAGAAFLDEFFGRNA